MFIILNLQGAGLILTKCVWLSHVKQLLFNRVCSSSPASEGRWLAASVLWDRVYQLRRCAWITSTTDGDADPEKPNTSAHRGNRPNASALILISHVLFNQKTVMWILWNFQRLFIIPPPVTMYMKSAGWKRKRQTSTVDTLHCSSTQRPSRHAYSQSQHHLLTSLVNVNKALCMRRSLSYSAHADLRICDQFGV